MTYTEKAVKRIIEQYNELGEHDQLKVLDRIKYEGIIQATQEVSKTKTVYFGDLYAEALDRQKTFFVFEGMRTGLEYFDKATMGLRPGETLTLAGPSNLGKTMVALNIIANVIVANNAKALVISMEMPALDIASRVFNMVNQQKHDHLMENLIIQTELDVNTKHIAAMIERHRPDLLMLDHVQFLANQEKAATEYERINLAVKKIQRLGIEYRLPIILISHVAKTRSGKNSRASAGDLKGSSSIEQDTDMVIMLNRTDEQRQTGELTVELVKHRKKNSTLYYRPCLLKFDGLRLAEQGSYSVIEEASNLPVAKFTW